VLALVSALWLGVVGAVSAPATAAPSTGTALSWGANGSGQLGNGTTDNGDVPVPVDLPDGVTVSDLSAGAAHSLALLSDGQVLAWGSNAYGQLGNGTTDNSDVPVPVDLPDGVTVTDLEAGGNHSLALLSNGQALAWGRNDDGQLGNGTTDDNNVPVPVDLPDGVTVTDLAAGWQHSLALSSDGRVLAWGANNVGQLGNGTNTPSNIPVSVDLPDGVIATDLEAGNLHSLALLSDGRVLAWGANNVGQLGNGTNTSSNVPVSVDLPDGVAVTKLSSGSEHTLALLSDRRVLAWGWNAFGQLGNGTNTTATAPVPVALPSGVTVTGLAAGGDHSLALLSDGQVLAWGHNGAGQLGDGTHTNRNVPVRALIPEGLVVRLIAAGTDQPAGDTHSLAWAERAPQPTTTTTLTAEPTKSAVGEPVTLTATVECSTGTPTGEVEFFDGDTRIGAATLNGGEATFTTSTLAEGVHELTARYQGSGACPASVSQAVRVTVTGGEDPKGGITVDKRDAKTGRPLAGAEFELWRETNGRPGLQTAGGDADTRIGEACTTDREGACRFPDLEQGEYYLRETAAPKGYKLPKNPVIGPYEITANGYGDDEGVTATIKNEPAKHCGGDGYGKEKTGYGTEDNGKDDNNYGRSCV
jgi:alpha-tubulin suppressor-like RCC1 family protein